LEKRGCPRATSHLSSLGQYRNPEPCPELDSGLIQGLKIEILIFIRIANKVQQKGVDQSIGTEG